MNIDPIKLNEYYKQYGRDKVDKIIEKLNYKGEATPKPLPKKESDTKPTIYIFRHGQTTDNADFIFSGLRDSKLTKEGEKQALELADKLKDKKIDMLISSPQSRAIDTMKLAISKNLKARNLEILEDKRIQERSYGDLQGKSKLELYLEDEDYAQKVRRSFDTVPPDGESLKMVCERVKEFCDEIVPLMKKDNVNVAVSCHGNSIRGFRKYFEDLSDEKTAEIETPLGQDFLSYVIE